MDEELQVEDLYDRLDCVHQINELAGQEIKELKSQNKDLKDDLAREQAISKAFSDSNSDILDDLYDLKSENQKLRLRLETKETKNDLNNVRSVKYKFWE